MLNEMHENDRLIYPDSSWLSEGMYKPDHEVE